MKAIVSVLGRDRPGIIAAVSGELYKHNINILDISQTVLSGYFTMVMQVDLSQMATSYQEINERLLHQGEDMGLEIRMQRTELFDAMHRI